MSGDIHDQSGFNEITPAHGGIVEVIALKARIAELEGVLGRVKHSVQETVDAVNDGGEMGSLLISGAHKVAKEVLDMLSDIHAPLAVVDGYCWSDYRFPWQCVEGCFANRCGDSDIPVTVIVLANKATLTTDDGDK